MKKIFTAFILIGIASTSIIAQNQQRVWYLNNQKVDFTGTTPVMTQGLPGNPSNYLYDARNGVANQNGVLEFYVEGNSIINKNGVSIGNTSPYSFP